MPDITLDKVRVPRFNTLIWVPEFDYQVRDLISEKGQVNKMREAIHKLEDKALNGSPAETLDSWLYVITSILNGLQNLYVPNGEEDRRREFIESGAQRLCEKLKNRSEGKDAKEGKDRKNEIAGEFKIFGGRSNIKMAIPELILPKYAFIPNEKHPKSQIKKMLEEVNEIQEAAEDGNVIETRNEWLDALTAALNGFQMVNMSVEDAKTPSNFTINRVKSYNSKFSFASEVQKQKYEHIKNRKINQFIIARI